MALGKKVTLTIDGYTIKLSSKIKFYQNDQIHLIFELIENTIVIKDGVASRAILPINPLSAILFFETPNGVDSVESAEIIDNQVVFHLKSKHTQHIGISKMQIQLMDEECCRLTLPEFEFEIKESIYNGQLETIDVALYDEDTNSILIDEDGNLIIVSRVIESKN